MQWNKTINLNKSKIKIHELGPGFICKLLPMAPIFHMPFGKILVQPLEVKNSITKGPKITESFLWLHTERRRLQEETVYFDNWDSTLHGRLRKLSYYKLWLDWLQKTIIHLHILQHQYPSKTIRQFLSTIYSICTLIQTSSGVNILADFMLLDSMHDHILSSTLRRSSYYDSHSILLVSIFATTIIY